jgi:hypothetical protein
VCILSRLTTDIAWITYHSIYTNTYIRQYMLYIGSLLSYIFWIEYFCINLLFHHASCYYVDQASCSNGSKIIHSYTSTWNSFIERQPRQNETHLECKWCCFYYIWPLRCFQSNVDYLLIDRPIYLHPIISQSL